MMIWNVEHTDEFERWWSGLDESQQEDATAIALLLMERGPQPPLPYSSAVKGSKHPHMRGLRAQSAGKPLRVFYAFDPRRSAFLLIGGGKTGDNRLYERMIPIAEQAVRHLYRRTRKGGVDPMTGHRPFNDLLKTLTPERRARVAVKAAALREEMTMEELRKARGPTQEKAAAALEVGQPGVAELEKRGDMLVSNLRHYVEALGGVLVTARFEDKKVAIGAVGEPSRDPP